MEIDTRVEGHGDAMAKVAEISLQAKECQQLTALTSCPVKTFVAKSLLRILFHWVISPVVPQSSLDSHDLDQLEA
jgi:hypothetical protein